MSRLNSKPIAHIIPINMKNDPAVQEGSPFPHLAGIELELENVGNAPTGVMKKWKMVPDESLRNGVEFVTSKPIANKDLEDAISDFYKAKVTSRNSPRTSTHIHVNVSDMSVGDIRAMFVISYMLEDSLFRVLGASRKYCGYCMQLTDMNPRRVNTFLTSTGQEDFTSSMSGPNSTKYYGFNINSIRKHGTAEFRYFPGGPKEHELTSWMKYCQQVKSAAKRTGLDGVLNLESPADIERWVIESFPDLGPELVAYAGAENSFEALQQVVAMFPEEDEATRMDKLVFVSDPLVRFAARRYLKTDYKEDFLRRNLLPLKVVTTREWYEKLEAARHVRSPEEQAAEEARLAEETARRGVVGQETTFDQFCRRHSGMNARGFNHAQYTTFLRRHKNTLKDMYAQHSRALAGQGIIVVPYDEHEYLVMIGEAPPRFQPQEEAVRYDDPAADAPNVAQDQFVNLNEVLRNPPPAAAPRATSRAALSDILNSARTINSAGVRVVEQIRPARQEINDPF